MFSIFTIALLAAVGCGGWIFNWMEHHNGHNVKNSLVVAAVAAILILLVLTAVLHIVLPK